VRHLKGRFRPGYGGRPGAATSSISSRFWLACSRARTENNAAGLIY
jgi:hypothetical protein